MNTFRSYPNVRSLKAALCLTLLGAAAGCRLNPFAKTVALPSAPPVPKIVKTAPPQPLPVDFDKIKPNEAGLVPILEYHELVADGKKTTDYQYNVGKFRADMERLYTLGYRPINLSDFVEGKIDCPAGTSPVILTFDDALRGQLDYTPDGKIDPNCVIGILQAMHQEHADWPLKGTFFVLPQRGTHDYFYQAEYSQAKMQWLAQSGFEIGNHTISHLAGIKHWPDARVEAEFAGAVKLIDADVPNYTVKTLALPFGVFPANKKLVIRGQSGGVSYSNICALKAGSAPAPSPVVKGFDPYYLPRIIPGDRKSPPGALFTIMWWLNYLEKNKIQKYVSDGDPNTFTVPKILAARVDPARLKATGCLERTY